MHAAIPSCACVGPTGVVAVRDLPRLVRVRRVLVVLDETCVVDDDAAEVDEAVVVPSVCVAADDVVDVVDVEDGEPPPPHPATTPASSAQRMRAVRRDTHGSLARPNGPAAQPTNDLRDSPPPAQSKVWVGEPGGSPTRPGSHIAV